MFDFFESFFNGSPEPKGFSHKLRIFSKVKKYIRSSLDEKNLVGLFKKEASGLISDKITCCDEDEWFTILNRFSIKVLKHFQKKFQEALVQANLIDLVESLASSFFAYFGMIPYIAGFASFAADKRLGDQLAGRFLVRGRQQSQASDHMKLAHFTDTFHEVNGVALTLKKQVEMAHRFHKDYLVITCDTKNRPVQNGIKNFLPIGVLHLPEYPEQRRSQNTFRSDPNGDTIPIPVITTLLMSKSLLYPWI